MNIENQVNPEIEAPKQKPSIFGIIMNPKEQCEKMREKPKVLVPLIIITVLTIVGSLLMINGMDFMNDPSLAGMSEEEIMMVAMVSQISFVIIGLLTPVITIFIITLGHFIIAKIASPAATFKQLFSMNTHIFIIGTISLLLNGLVFMFIGGDPEKLFTSLNSIVGAEGFLGVFLNSIEIFAIWSYIITAMGLQIVAKFSKGLAWTTVIAFYIIGLVMQMISVGFSMMLGV